MKPIGGFFELEVGQRNSSYHPNAIGLSSGRACLNLILQSSSPRKLYLPFYICNPVIELVARNQVPYELYSINQKLEPAKDFDLREDEYLLFVNYFGILSNSIKDFINRYKEQVLVDNSQAFFEKGYTNIWSFNSARKFFGVFDGGFLYSPQKLKHDFPRNSNIRYAHLVNRLMGNQQLAYKQYLESESNINSDINRISLFSESLLCNIDYNTVIKKRRDNFLVVSEALNKYNCLSCDLDVTSSNIPLCYPFLPSNQVNKELFFNKNIFIPTYWEDVNKRSVDGFNFEKDLSQRLLPLPIDHRLSRPDLERIINIVTELCL